MNIDEVLKVLNYLDFDYKVEHTNDFSQIIIPTNNEGANLCLMFDCESREIYSKDYEQEES